MSFARTDAQFDKLSVELDRQSAPTHYTSRTLLAGKRAYCVGLRYFSNESESPEQERSLRSKQ